MENRSETSASPINRLSIFSLVVGLLSVILYLPLHLFPYLVPPDLFFNPAAQLPPYLNVLKTVANAIPVGVYFIGGIFLGAIGLSFSAQALRQIKEGNVRNRSRVVAITGRIFSILGIIVNILSIPIFLMQ